MLRLDARAAATANSEFASVASSETLCSAAMARAWRSPTSRRNALAAARSLAAWSFSI
ncbi:hypothetical protein [Leifsonia poae]|uniref:hypothetical protein n=1 Tax=Leifsonia poae TaxID=110933 RepID=UPI003D665D9A